MAFKGAVRFILVVFGCILNVTWIQAQIKYINGHNQWDADSLGNHRAVVEVLKPGKTAKIDLAWRLPQINANQLIIAVDAKTNSRIVNIKTENISREKGTIYFEPVSGAGTYYIYYLPYKVTARSNYPQAIYRTAKVTASADWLGKTSDYTIAKLKAFESVNAMNSFYPMEVIATTNETASLIKQNSGKRYLLFTEDRMHPIKLRHDLPQRWVQKGMTCQIKDTARRGENFSYQLGLYPVNKSLKNVTLSFTDLKDDKGNKIPAKQMSCLNTGGTNYDGTPLNKTVDVNKGDVQALWCLVNITKETKPALYYGTVTLYAANAPSTTIKIELKVSDTIAIKGGVDEPWKQTRLTWLNSKLAQQNDVIKPYIPLKLHGNTISLLGRKLILNNSGLPQQIQTFFTPEMTCFSTTPKNILQQPIQFSFISAASHKNITLTAHGITYTCKQPGTIKWAATNSSDALRMQVNGSIEFDGYMFYTVKVTALKDVVLDDTKLDIPFSKQSSKYLIGLNYKGGYRADPIDWKWDVANKNQDGAWIGDVNAGLQYSLRDEKYIRPLNTNFYLVKPLLLPASWGNEGKGGIKIAQTGDAVLADNYSGGRQMKKGDILYYNFTLLITPFHPINTDFQWDTRFYHHYNNIDTIKATGATVINIHHATPINPYINYPFIAHNAMKAYIDSAHTAGLRVKIYNTVRELSNSAYETFPLRSLGHEVYSTGKGGGYSYLQEHLEEDYIPGWYVPEIKDVAIVNSGMNRWHNYYVEGMNWLVQNVGIDGIYLDDVAFDRITMKRVKRVLTRDGHPGIIDLHSANQYDKSDGFNNSANLYMEHFPYLNRLWFGEYFDYENNTPDFFLTEVSGIPFGLMGEMLQGGGNPWRGMIYGMTNRMPWSDNADPRPIWKAWDDFGIKGSSMIGYWVDNNPVKTNDPNILATVYKKDKKALIAVASWAKDEKVIKLAIDWKALGIDPKNATITAPEIKNFQPAATFTNGGDITVPKGKGWLIIIQ